MRTNINLLPLKPTPFLAASSRLVLAGSISLTMILGATSAFGQASTSAGPFTFETGTASSNQFTANFRALSSPAGQTSGQTDPADVAEPNNDYVFNDNTGTGGVFVGAYDNTPLDSTSGTTPTFAGPITIKLDISAVQANSSFGIYLFNATNGGDNLLALFNLDNTGTTDLIRFFKDGDIVNGGAGTQVGGSITGNAGLDVSTEAAPVFGTMTVTYTPASNGNTALTLSIGSFSASQLIADADAIASPGIALRLFDVSSTAGTAKLDNFSIVPEPSTAISLLGGIGCLCGLQRFRRRA